MSRQRESIRIVDPFKGYLKYQGWHVENIHGNMYQCGLPDSYIMHGHYTPRWVEYKVINDHGTVSLTAAQKKVWPIWIAHGVPFWIVCGRDFRGLTGKPSMVKEYKKLFDPPNAHWFLESRNMREYLKGC